MENPGRDSPATLGRLLLGVTSSPRLRQKKQRLWCKNLTSIQSLISQPSGQSKELLNLRFQVAFQDAAQAELANGKRKRVACLVSVMVTRKSPSHGPCKKKVTGVCSIQHRYFELGRSTSVFGVSISFNLEASNLPACLVYKKAMHLASSARL